MTSQLWVLIGNGVLETLQMTVSATILAYLIGLPIGIALVVTAKEHILQNRIVNLVLGVLMNIFRSIPFLILLVVLIPFTRFVTGSSIGTTATIVPLTVGAIPIVARMVESSLKEVPSGIVEAAQSMGASPISIIFRFIIPEAMPSLLLGATINLATVLGYSAMAGCIGGGGLGAIALNYGYYRYQQDILFITVAILIIIVQVFQESGTLLANKKRHS
ncbi:MAG: ABC transporter permease [Oscillospiraceae bacterium]|jgi:D-methionine transport system permease protein|nr:ABC transporter permease [Oscillospiraceae bacterium]